MDPFQIEHSLIAIVTLKRRRWSVREVPIPPALMQMIAREFSLVEQQCDAGAAGQRLWTMSRTTAWRVVIPARGLAIETRALNARSWMGTSFPYWEGPISFTGSHAGLGYLEMTGY